MSTPAIQIVIVVVESRSKTTIPCLFRHARQGIVGKRSPNGRHGGHFVFSARRQGLSPHFHQASRNPFAVATGRSARHLGFPCWTLSRQRIHINHVGLYEVVVVVFGSDVGCLFNENLGQ
mgnify:CR=1 FL=1